MMFCVYSKHEDQKDNSAQFLVSVRRKYPEIGYLLICCKRCAYNIANPGKYKIEYWDRIPRTDDNPWVHMVLTEV